jgi:L-ribulokinase
VTSLGSAIFAFLAAGVYKSIEQAQKALCPKFRVVKPQPAAVAVYQDLYPLYRKLYFALGKTGAPATALGDVLPALRQIAAKQRAK